MENLKIKKTSHIILFLSYSLLALTFVSCGDDDDPVDSAFDNMKNTARGLELMGTWESECKDSDIMQLSMKDYYFFRGNDFTQRTEYFSEGDCQEPIARLDYQGDFEIKDEVAGLEEAREINLKYEKAQLTALNQEGAKALSLMKICGISEWEVNKTEDLSGDRSTTAPCPILNVPQTYYNIYDENNNELYFGLYQNMNDLTDTASRPKELNRDEVFKESEHSINE